MPAPNGRKGEPWQDEKQLPGVLCFFVFFGVKEKTHRKTAFLGSEESELSIFWSYDSVKKTSEKELSRSYFYDTMRCSTKMRPDVVSDSERYIPQAARLQVVGRVSKSPTGSR